MDSTQLSLSSETIDGGPGIMSSDKRVLSIQGHVVWGYAGGCAAVFPLQVQCAMQDCGFGSQLKMQYKIMASNCKNFYHDL